MPKHSTTPSGCSRRRFLHLASGALLGLGLGGWGATRAEATAAAAPAGLSAISGNLAAAIAAYPGEVALAVTDARSGETVAVNADRPQIAGCTANLPLLLAVVEDLAAGAYPLAEVDWIVRATVGASDARWGGVLARRVGRGSLARGVDRVAALSERLGLRGSVYDHAPGYWGAYSRADRENVVTAADMNAVLLALYRGQLFDVRWTQYALAKLLDVRPQLNNMLPALLPRGVRVAHKVGFINLYGYATRNDAGLVLVDRPGGQLAYAVTFLSQHNANYWDAARFAARLSRFIYDRFVGLYA